MLTASVCPARNQRPPDVRAHAVVADPDGNVLADAAILDAKPRRRWSELETTSLRERYATMEPVRLLAESLHRSAGSVYAKARRLQLKRPKVSACRLPTKQASAASMIVVPSVAPSAGRERIRSNINGVRGVWFDGVNERAARLWMAGFHAKTIATVLGPQFTSSSVSTKAHRLGYPRRAHRRCLSKDLDEAFRIDREAAPLCETLQDPNGQVRVRRRCGATGNIFYAERGQHYSPQAKETKSWKEGCLCL
jgi:hypothetical protein